jgi:hypothetical protein
MITHTQRVPPYSQRRNSKGRHTPIQDGRPSIFYTTLLYRSITAARDATASHIGLHHYYTTHWCEIQPHQLRPG